MTVSLQSNLGDRERTHLEKRKMLSINKDGRTFLRKGHSSYGSLLGWEKKGSF